MDLWYKVYKKYITSIWDIFQQSIHEYKINDYYNDFVLIIYNQSDKNIHPLDWDQFYEDEQHIVQIIGNDEDSDNEYEYGVVDSKKSTTLDIDDILYNIRIDVMEYVHMYALVNILTKWDEPEWLEFINLVCGTRETRVGIKLETTLNRPKKQNRQKKMNSLKAAIIESKQHQRKQDED